MKNKTKENIEALAVFGGIPRFDSQLHVGRPNVGDRERLFERINNLLDRRWLTNNGMFVRELETRLADFLGVNHCVVMCNGTVALEIAIRAIGLEGEVIIPSFTFVATAHALQWQGIRPVFCDIRRETHNIDPCRIEELISDRTTGIVGVHTWGRPCEIESLAEIAERRNLKLLFDAAHAFGCSYKGRMIGNFGEAEIFSFHATKFFNTFEGGAIATNYDELAGKIRLMKNFGFAGYDKVIYIGTNGKMSEVAAAMGLTGIECLEEFIATNLKNYNLYRKELDKIPGIALAEYNGDEKANYQYIIIEIDPKITGITRDELLTILYAENVLARRYFYPGCHKMEPYRSYFPGAETYLPQTAKLADRVMSLPTGTSVDERDIMEICRLLRFAAANGSDISRRLKIKSGTQRIG